MRKSYFVFGFRPVMLALSSRVVVPLPAYTSLVFDPYDSVVPYSKSYVVSRPVGFTVPCNDAAKLVTFVAAPVFTTGFPAARAGDADAAMHAVMAHAPMSARLTLNCM